MLHRRLLLVVLTAALALLPAGSALAGTAATSTPDQTVRFTDGSGPGATETNDVTFSVVANRIRVHDINPLHPGTPDCSQVDANTVDCAVATSITTVAATLGPGDDAVQNPSGKIGSFSGGDGSDSLVGGAAADTLDGGAGPDDLSGGGGADTATYASRTNGVVVSLDGIGNDGEGCPNIGTCEGDNVNADIENVTGGAGADTLMGNGGANTLHGGAGNDALLGGAGADTLTGDDANDLLLGGAGADTLSGNNGVDTVSYADHTANVIATLNGGTGASAEDGTGDTIASDVENLSGGAGADRLTGSTSGVAGGGANTLSGGGGDDTLSGLTGPDDLSGGSGQDTVNYGTGGEGRTADLAVSEDNAANDGEAGEGDNVRTDVETVTGGDGNDTITGSSVANQLLGGAGNDTLDGGGGADVIDGQAGGDTVSYASHSAGARIALSAATTTGNGSPGEGDQIVRVENARGGAGDDTLVSAPAAANNLAGGGGTDVVDYSTRTTTVTVTLDDAAGDGEAGENDNVANDVENVRGGGGDDVLSGAGGVNNRLEGGAGNDQLNGGAGDDTLLGGPGTDTLGGQAGDDTLDGGTGADTLGGSTGSDTANYGTRINAVTVTFDGNADDGESGEGDNVATDVENAIGGAGDDTLTGSEVANRLTGGDGSDSIDGAGGDDTILARDGVVDRIACGSENDQVSADEADTIAADCEQVFFGPLPTPGQPGPAPEIQTPQVAASTPTPQPKPKATRAEPRSVSLAVTPRRDRRAPYRFVLSGVVSPPSGISRQTTCADGRVSAVVKAGTQTVTTRSVGLDLRCRYRITLSFANRRRLGRGRLTVTVRYLGSTGVAPRSARSLTLRAG